MIHSVVFPDFPPADYPNWDRDFETAGHLSVVIGFADLLRSRRTGTTTGEWLTTVHTNKCRLYHADPNSQMEPIQIIHSVRFRNICPGNHECLRRSTQSRRDIGKVIKTVFVSLFQRLDEFALD
jgi:hypothetical protein